MLFAHTDTSQAKGKEFMRRFVARTEDCDASTSLALRDAQYDAIVEWGIPDHSALQRLTAINCPALVVQGEGDLMIPTKLSHLLTGLIPDGRIRIYPDAGHGSCSRSRARLRPKSTHSWREEHDHEAEASERSARA